MMKALRALRAFAVNIEIGNESATINQKIDATDINLSCDKVVITKSNGEEALFQTKLIKTLNCEPYYVYDSGDA